MSVVINVYNETQICDKCGKSPVEFIVGNEDNSVTNLCAKCYRVFEDNKNS